MNNQIDVYNLIKHLFGYLTIALVFIETIFSAIVIRQMTLLDRLLKTKLAIYLKIFAVLFFLCSLFVLLYTISIFL